MCTHKTQNTRQKNNNKKLTLFLRCQPSAKDFMLCVYYMNGCIAFAIQYSLCGVWASFNHSLLTYSFLVRRIIWHSHRMKSVLERERARWFIFYMVVMDYYTSPLTYQFFFHAPLFIVSPYFHILFNFLLFIFYHTLPNPCLHGRWKKENNEWSVANTFAYGIINFLLRNN